MSRKTTSTGAARASKKKAKASTTEAASKSATQKSTKKKAKKKSSKATAARKKAVGTAVASPVLDKPSANQSLATEIDVVVKTMTDQMNDVMTRLNELTLRTNGNGASNRESVKAESIDRTSSTFHRLVDEVVEDRLAEMLPPMIALRNELAQRDDDEPSQRGAETLDHVLSLAGVSSYEAREGESCDPLIHLAVDEVKRKGLADGAVAENLQAGFRTARGKVIVPARVKVNRK